MNDKTPRPPPAAPKVEAPAALHRLTVPAALSEKLKGYAEAVCMTDRDAAERALEIGTYLLTTGRGLLLIDIAAMRPDQAFEFGQNYGGAVKRPNEVGR